MRRALLGGFVAAALFAAHMVAADQKAEAKDQHAAIGAAESKDIYQNTNTDTQWFPQAGSEGGARQDAAGVKAPAHLQQQVFPHLDSNLGASVRNDVVLDSGWRFAQGDPAKAETPKFDDAAWASVSIPHCWGWADAQQGREYYRGPGWYRREFDVTPEPGKRYFLRFEAASLVADVYLNGQHLGQHRGGFGAFCFEVTSNLAASARNLLAVRVSNEKFSDVAPLDGDFNVYGGIYRPVHLIETGEENFTLTDHASPGVEWLQTHVTETQAVLEVKAQISKKTKGKRSLELVARVLDAQGKEVAGLRQPITLQEKSFVEPFFLHLTLDKPHLWNGVRDPYLYRSVVELRSGDQVLDRVEQPLGLRFYSVDPEKGFFLNGRPYRVKGVCKHQDRKDKGWAVSDAELAQDVALIKEMGANAVRCAHYQHSDTFYSLCDQAGLLVWAEIPLVNIIRDTTEFEDTSRNQLLDLIRQNINHPSVFVWSLSNEIGNGNRTDDPHRGLMDLNAIAHGEDPTHPTINAVCMLNLPQINRIPDLLGWNLYPGWYSVQWGKVEDWGRCLEKFRHTSRRGGYCVSEYGAGANITQHEDNPPQPNCRGQWHPEEWQAIVHEIAWREIKSRPYVWGSFVWNMFDFSSWGRKEGDQPGMNDKGLVTFDRLIKKDAFYFYQASWSDEPVLYITSRRFTERTNAVTEVKIYSNAKKAELFVNGASQGMRDNDSNAVFLWKNVKLAAGENHIEARAERAGQKLSDTCVWTLKAQ